MRADRLFGATAACLALLFLIVAVPSISGDWQQGADARYFTVGPRLFPYVAGGLTLLFSVLIALRPDGRNRIATLGAPGLRRNVAVAVGVAVGYVALLDVLGFVAASALALAAFFLGFGERRWLVVLPMALVVPVVVKTVFLEMFMLELPSGMLDLPF